MESVIETGAERVRAFLKQLRGKVYVTFEEGTQANWLHDVVRPLVTEVVVYEPRHNKLLQSFFSEKHGEGHAEIQYRNDFILGKIKNTAIRAGAVSR